MKAINPPTLSWPKFRLQHCNRVLQQAFTIAICIAAPLAVAAPAVTLTFQPGGQLNLSISNSNPNLIAVPGDKITSISSASGMLTDKKNTDSGAVLFSSMSEKPFTFYVETKLGQVFSVNANPRKGDGRNYRLFSQSPSPRPAARAWEESQPYETMLISLNRAYLQGVLPEGYGPADIEDEPQLSASGLKAIPESAWTGHSLRIVRYRLVNPLSIPVDIREQDFWKKGDRAVMVNPKYNRLIAGASTYLYVTRTQEITDEQH